MRKGRRWHGARAVAGVMVLPLAMIHPVLFCSALGALRSVSTPNGEAKLAAGLQENGDSSLLRQEQEHALEGASHEPLPSSDASATPEQIHISLAASGSTEEYAVTVAWATWPKSESQVVWGSSAQQRDNIASGSSTSEWCPTARAYVRAGVD